MKSYPYTIIVSVWQDPFVKGHGGLFVTAKEINLNPFYANLLQPGHFLLTGNRRIHFVLRRLWRIVPPTVWVVPQDHRYVFIRSILHQLFHFIPANTGIPPVINQHIFKIKFGGHIDVLDLVLVINAVILPDNPAPGGPTHLVIFRWLVQRLNHIVTHRCLNDRL